ncbi:MAG: transcription termination factor NusA [Oscillospiraceae bacterium]|nr:transcription termination factor NusA [Oscillospiraceae bacterium]
MNAEIMGALEQLEKEKGIPKEYMLDKITQALLAAYKKDNTGYTDNVSVRIIDGEMKIFVEKEVVEDVQFPATEISVSDAQALSPGAVDGDVVNVEIKAKQFGRIAAQTAKGVIIQGIREAEREVVYGKFNSKSREMLTGTVLRIEPGTGDMVIRIGTGSDKTDALLSRSEQVEGEVYVEGQTIRVYVVDVYKSNHGAQIKVSRTHPGLVKRLFELEVPEIADGTVEVKSIAREAGSRTKLAVWSSNPDVDPVGTCVGPRGGRVGAVVNELNGEKMDIIKYSEDPAAFIASALSPADVLEVTTFPGTKNCRVVVPDDQLSLAIGKEGQNARLAARLTGYKIDIKSKTAAAELAALEAEEAEEPAEEEEFFQSEED